MARAGTQHCVALAALESKIRQIALADVRTIQGAIIPMHEAIVTDIRALARDAARYRALCAASPVLRVHVEHTPPRPEDGVYLGDDLDALLDKMIDAGE